jgi:hypothetical protein
MVEFGNFSNLGIYFQILNSINNLRPKWGTSLCVERKQQLGPKSMSKKKKKKKGIKLGLTID